MKEKKEADGLRYVWIDLEIILKGNKAPNWRKDLIDGEINIIITDSSFKIIRGPNIKFECLRYFRHHEKQLLKYITKKCKGFKEIKVALTNKNNHELVWRYFPRLYGFISA